MAGQRTSATSGAMPELTIGVVVRSKTFAPRGDIAYRQPFVLAANHDNLDVLDLSAGAQATRQLLPPIPPLGCCP